MPKRLEADSDASDSDSNASASSDSNASVASVSKDSKTVKVFSNKSLDASKVPPKPLMPAKAPKTGRSFDWRLIFTNGTLLRKFLEPAAHAVKKMRFVVRQGPKFTGFEIECHDQAFTLADRGIFECDVDCGRKNKDASADGSSFCVNAEAFMEALVASTLKETDLRITRYMTTDGSESNQITFESTNNENDVRTVYNCNLVDSSSVDSLDGITIELGFHVTVQMSTLKELSLNAKRCGAPTLHFDLWQAVDSDDPTIMHSKMCVGFEGTNTSGSHDFFMSMKKTSSKRPDGTMQITWTPVSTPEGLDALEIMNLEKKCSNEYDNKKLRMFLNHMECQYVLVHLCTDNTTQPLVLDCIIGGANTKHTVIVAPKESGSN
jgi:hypothetical protein